MSLQFEPISLDHQDEYIRHLKQMPQLSSDYSFVNLWAWSEEYQLAWAWDNDLVWIRQGTPPSGYWAPVGDWNQVDWRNRLASCPEKLPFLRIPEELTAHWSSLGLFTVKEAREHWDYLYSVQDLIELKGNRFHGKKNLLRQFQGKYVAEYISLDCDFVEQALLMQMNWCNWRNCEASAGLAAEDRVITKVLKAYDSFSALLGGVLLVNGDIVAFTVAEKLDDETLVVHFEKGMGGYKGVYQAINYEFMKEHSEFKVVNREQDLGNEGLRKAKLSYNPSGYIKKNELHWL